MSLEKTLRWIVLAGIFVLPFIVLYVSRSLFFPFITGKNFAFRIIIEIISGAWLSLALVYPIYRPKRSWLLYAFVAFVGIILVADLFGTYPHKSIWSNFERMEGWITLIHLLMYFIVAHSVLNTEQLWRNWWHTSLGVSVLVGFYALFQLLGFITINQGGIRLDATFGNATYLGVYMMFHIFIAALFLARGWVEQPKKRIILASMYGSMMALSTLILFFTSTRGAILGLFGGATLSALIMIFLAPRSSMAWRAGVAIVGLVIIVGIFYAARDSAFVQNIEPLNRLSQTFDEGVPGARVMNWGMATQGFKERPILGWGQENYAAVFDKYYNPQMYAQEPWFDRVHNTLFDWLIAGGILGLLAYLSIYACALYAIWKTDAFALYERALLTGLLAGYIFYLIFTFDNITSYLIFVALLAYIATRGYVHDKTIAAGMHLDKRVLPWIPGVAVLAVWGIAWYVNADSIAQNRTVIQGISPQSAGVSKNLEYFKQAVARGKIGQQESREQFSQAGISLVGAQGIPAELKNEFVAAAVESMRELSNIAPHNARFPLFMGILLDHAGVYPDAKVALERAHELSPTKQSILFELGLNAFARGQADEAVARFKQAYELAPEFEDAKYYYISALIRAGKDAEADPLVKELIDADRATDQRIASAYASRSRFDRIASIWTAHIAKKPEDIEARFMLAGAYYSAGNSAQAIKELEEIKKVAPNATTQADALIQQVKSGVK